jgi:hypothetical protein
VAAYHAFDFWIGEWNVFRPDGQKAGENTIQSVLGGCALQESWHGVLGGTGNSLNAFERNSGRWYQTWIDSGGGLLLLSGGLKGDSMVMTGESFSADAKKVIDRVSWVALPDGRVRQHWQKSTDAGATWQTVFEGFYVRKSQDRK